MDTPFKRILVPLDGSEQAEAVLPLVRSLAQAADAQIVLLRVAGESPETEAVYPTAPALMGMLSPELEGELLRDAEDARMRTLAGARHRAEGYLQCVATRWLRAAQVTTEVSFGPAAEVILQFAHGMPADVVVLSTHGWTPIR
jgi:nucleotide-binding universal stress UspA family protein